MANNTSTFVYSRAHAEKFVSDSMRNALRDIIREHGLSPELLMQQWEAWVERGVRAWLASGHLTAMIVEFFEPGASTITTRWDFPIDYASSGIEDDMGDVAVASCSQAMARQLRWRLMGDRRHHHLRRTSAPVGRFPRAVRHRHRPDDDGESG